MSRTQLDTPEKIQARKAAIAQLRAMGNGSRVIELEDGTKMVQTTQEGEGQEVISYYAVETECDEEEPVDEAFIGEGFYGKVTRAYRCDHDGNRNSDFIVCKQSSGDTTDDMLKREFKGFAKLHPSTVHRPVRVYEPTCMLKYLSNDALLQLQELLQAEIANPSKSRAIEYSATNNSDM
jgi:hypothetical protein